MSILNESIAQLHNKIKNKEVSVSDLVNASYERIKAVDSNVKAFITLDEECAKQRAKELDELVAEGREIEPLFGLPAGIKDNIMTKGLTTTCSSKMLENFEPFHNATVVDKLEQAQAVTIGKLNLDEFAMGSSTNTGIQTTANPWNLEYVPGGSSGGSAAAVSAGEVVFALGTDTGGSIRQPAAYCGVVGMKPTYGLVSRFGAVAFASSLDQIGPITRTVEDNAYVLQAIAGHDPLDSTSVPVDVPNYVSALTGDVKGLKIAVPKEYLAEATEEVRQSVSAALKVLEGLGATWEEISLPHSKYAAATYYLVSSGEASANLARFDGVRFGFRADVDNLDDLYDESRRQGLGAEVKRRILLGTFSQSTGYYDDLYVKAQRVRTLIKQEIDQVFEKYDVIIGPTTVDTAFKASEATASYGNDILNVPTNLAGVPAISVPCGMVNGLPVGLQVIGKHFDEQTIYRVAHAYEQATEHHKAKPQL